jgi:hypothetical protein
MNKDEAVNQLGASAPGWSSLLQPARLRAALCANDRLKLYLSVLQAAAAHAHAPHQALLDLARQLHEDLGVMARPLLAQADADPALAERVGGWQARLQALAAGGSLLDEALLRALTSGQPEAGDSLHRLVMDLHKALNRLAARLASDNVAGAHAWDLATDGSDRPRIEAFMRGLERTRALKGEHPGLDTAATREGARLMIQNDIGTNDAHVIVLQVDTGGAAPSISLTYSDLHRQRFAFFQRLLAEVGAQGGPTQSRQTPGLNAGEAYHVGSARFAPADEAALQQMLEGIGERIVFLIDWNRARKRLLPFVDKAAAVAVLDATARQRVGHLAWLTLGGERLIWNAMAAQGPSAFRLGDRLDEVMGEDAAAAFLVEALALADRARAQAQPPALVADQVRTLLAQRLQGRHGGFEDLAEHAGLCHAMAQGLRDALAHGHDRDAAAAAHLAARAKTWERQADHLVMRARSQAERYPQWQPLLRLLERSDDVADALEEACFVLGLRAEQAGSAPAAVREALQALADCVLGAVQDHLKALTVAATLAAAQRRGRPRRVPGRLLAGAAGRAPCRRAAAHRPPGPGPGGPQRPRPGGPDPGQRAGRRAGAGQRCPAVAGLRPARARLPTPGPGQCLTFSQRPCPTSTPTPPGSSAAASPRPTPRCPAPNSWATRPTTWPAWPRWACRCRRPSCWARPGARRRSRPGRPSGSQPWPRWSRPAAHTSATTGGPCCCRCARARRCPCPA